MNYSEMSDFEINKRVLEIKSGIRPIGYAHHADKRSAAIVDVNNNYHWYDFCNSWADAGPIIQKNNISILIDDTTQKWSSASVQDFTNVSAYKFGNCHENPLRAAMIVFLMMRDAGNA
ncbi:phage protein NinX family protein [Pantoea ananatis]|uniref:phage protein NinX family protein n=1 Tax=Pantoea ananas TaxID=553 RepID=UPI000490AB3D|nr:phage protein NinX family protein [Pantoea ananatis]NQE76653.1 hypothetical protein [Pantoea ananatis]NQE81289.1 hypothetical protein [Pantoea ananatis]